ncbi:delta-like protein 4 [Heptranchias perlo]|uniref:delta-like protein 4 n=1 Tax=Heptranchias perlo TaxID=212740 RepID=UPI00355955F1
MASNCTACEPGYYCADPAEPKLCPQGFYSHGSSASCLPCHAGYVCRPGSKSPNPAENICSLGRYCSGKNEYVCPKGTCNPHSGSRSFSDGCMPCPCGYYCDEEGLSDCKKNPCPPGFFCPLGTRNYGDFPCPAGTYNNQTAAATQEQCLPCPAGWLCRQSTVDPDTRCPSGFFCTEGQRPDSLRSCPVGTFSNWTGLQSKLITIGICRKRQTSSGFVRKILLTRTHY